MSMIQRFIHSCENASLPAQENRSRELGATPRKHMPVELPKTWSLTSTRQQEKGSEEATVSAVPSGHQPGTQSREGPSPLHSQL